MKNKGLYIQLCLLFLTILTSRADVLNCVRAVNGAYFDLSELSATKDYVIPNVNSAATTDAEKIALVFNICRFPTAQCNSKFAFAYLYQYQASGIYQSSTDCVKLTNTTKFDSISYSSVDSDKPESGVQILFEGGDKIDQTVNSWTPITGTPTDPTNTYSVDFAFRCDSSVDGANIDSWSFDQKTYRYTINIISSSACALLSIDQVSQFISDNPIPFTIVGAVIGLAVAVLGLKLFLPTLFITGFASGFFIALFVFFGEVVTPDSRESTKWILVGFAVVMGLLLGFIAVKANKFGLFIIGALLGVILALLLYNAILFKIQSNPAELVLLITLGVLGVGFGVLALVFYKHVIIIATSLIGSYCFVRSLSLVIGGFPNEIQLIQQVQTQDYNFATHWPFYIYMNVVFLLTLFTIYVQYKIKKRSEANEVDFDAEYFKGAEV
jgi:hypothetical protein